MPEISEKTAAPAPTVRKIETDYLIVGAGAMGMAFADALFKEQPDLRFVFVDKRARPGGHWLDAYGYVGLHQPAAFYGLNSAKLGTGGADLASGPEIIAYFHRAMQRMVDSGRVEFIGKSEYMGDGRIESVLDRSQVTKVTARKRIVDGTFMDVQVPSTHPPRYDVAADVDLVPPNELPRLRQSWDNYTVVGSGKTGIDAILFLMDSGVPTDRIRWIMPSDAWLWDRTNLQPGLMTMELMREMEAIIEHRDVDAIFFALEKLGSVHRVDKSRNPTTWRCASVVPEEVDKIRRVRDIVRMGRVSAITADEIRLADGNLQAEPHTLYIDCTACGLSKRPPTPLFEPGKVTLQSVFMCQQVFSAAILGRIEAMNVGDSERNALVHIVPHPEHKRDMPKAFVNSLENMVKLNAAFPLWMRRARLNFMHHDTLPTYIKGALTAKKRVPHAIEALEDIQRKLAAETGNA